MGLDVYAHTTSEIAESLVDFEVNESTEIGHWYNDEDFADWLECQYIALGGLDRYFQRRNVLLEADDLNAFRERFTDERYAPFIAAVGKTHSAGRSVFCYIDA